MRYRYRFYLSTILRLEIGNVLTVWYFLFSFYNYVVCLQDGLMNIIPGQAKATSCKKLNTSWIEKLSSF
jgi:hypothetical protein